MIMTVKAAHKRLAELEKQAHDFIRLQDYALHIDLQNRHDKKHKDRSIYLDRQIALNRISSEASLTVDIRTLGTIGAELCKAEMQRIQDIIDNTEVNI